MLLAEVFEAVKTFLEHIERSAVGNADGVVVAEGNAGHGGHLVAVEQFFAQLQRAHAQLGGVDEEVEGTLGLHYFNLGHGGKTAVYVLAAEVVLLAKIRDEALVTGESLDGTVLAEGGGVGGRVVLDELDVFGNVLIDRVLISF